MNEEFERVMQAMQAISDAAEQLAAKFAKLIIDIDIEIKKERGSFKICKYARGENYYRKQWKPTVRMYRVQKRG